MFNEKQNLIINAIDELKATRLSPTTPRKIQEITGLSDNDIFEEMEFLRGRGYIAEIGM